MTYLDRTLEYQWALTQHRFGLIFLFITLNQSTLLHSSKLVLEFLIISEILRIDRFTMRFEDLTPGLVPLPNKNEETGGFVSL